MKRILIDTNVILDLLAHRIPFYEATVGVFNLAAKKHISLFISALSVADTFYILRKTLGNKESLVVIRDLLSLAAILPVDQLTINQAIDSEFSDFEDAIQNQAALQNNMEILVTRDLTGFKSSPLPVMTPAEFLAIQ
ncbi:MAG: hypothetical protein A2X22_11740 [Bacteroidetes bacterium GWF2_49_14]|nr:MAG: hypothetical protein A2X22_11740 [Bacteroidetes bacterium GWF2_49_14]HBB92807.1 hypothetical protein [Bacteroidales bacterium]